MSTVLARLRKRHEDAKLKKIDSNLRKELAKAKHESCRANKLLRELCSEANEFRYDAEVDDRSLAMARFDMHEKVRRDAASSLADRLSRDMGIKTLATCNPHNITFRASVFVLSDVLISRVNQALR